MAKERAAEREGVSWRTKLLLPKVRTGVGIRQYRLGFFKTGGKKTS